MSNLINKDKRAKYNAAKVFHSVRECDNHYLENYSPFSEFDEHSKTKTNMLPNTQSIKTGNIHFGLCPSIITNVEHIDFDTKTTNIIMVVFSIVKPLYCGEPFLEFYVQRTHNDTLSFPFATIQPNGLMNEGATNILNSLKMTTTHKGFFKYDENTYYSIFEAEHYALTHLPTHFTERINHIYSNNDSMWITTSEIINKQVLNMDIENNVFIFISEIGEGITKLYHDDKLIPCPRIGYIGGDIDFIQNTIEQLNSTHIHSKNKEYINIGDFNYGIISAFFKDIPDNHRNETIKEMHNSGVILRVAFWDKPYKCKETEYTVRNAKRNIPNSANGDYSVYTVINTAKQQCYPLTIHHGEIYTNSVNTNSTNQYLCDTSNHNINALQVLNNKMIIFK